MKIKETSRVLFNKTFRTNSTLKRELAILAVPIFIETLLMMALGAVDTFMLSKFSDASVAAVGFVNQIINFCFLIFEVINLGTSVLCSQYLGAGLQTRMERLVGVSLLVNLLFGLTISIFLFFCGESILLAMGLSDDMLEEGISYMRIVGLGAFVMALAMTLSATLRANNKAYFPMLVIAIINVLNISGNYMLIFGKFGAPALGVTGAAISTVVSRTIAMCILFFIVFRTTLHRFPTEIFRRFPRTELKNLLRIGLPSAGEQMSYSSSQLVITYFINMLGMEAMATRTYCVNIIMFGYLFCISIAQGGAICIGHLIGAGKQDSAFILGKYVLKKSVLFTLLISVCIACCGPYIMSLLTENRTIASLAITILWVDVVLEIGRPVNIFACAALRTAGDVNFPFYVGVVVQWSVAVMASYYFGIVAGMGLVGIWWMFALDENIRGAIFVRRWYSDKWRNKGFAVPELRANV
jgi:putative MATE family efflux protein